MTDNGQQQDADSLRQTRFTTGGGWEAGTTLTDHPSSGSPALAEIDGTIHLVYPAPLVEGEDVHHFPIVWTFSTPGAASAQGGQWAIPEDTYIGLDSTTPPSLTLANHNGTLRLAHSQFYVYKDADAHPNGCSLAIHEAHLEAQDSPESYWSSAHSSLDRDYVFAPALAAFNGAAHLLYLHAGLDTLAHWVSDSRDTWRTVSAADGAKVIPPRTDADNKKAVAARGIARVHYPGSLGLAVHDGRLHALYRPSLRHGNFLHASFDGSTWSEVAPAIDAPYSLGHSDHNPALTSYDGQLHAVFPSDDDKLSHMTWTENGGWTKPVQLDDHKSRHTPALLTYKDGPAGAEQDVLLLVYRGTEGYQASTHDSVEPDAT
ncbi:hypothetical protein ACFWJT_37950 [Streptomyces sp. NPDC127069]|uniref:hypothetical protein n=1 Tax=Streptomyces sp. NPDC127069 TaxID=3347128 RepID=UPI00364813F7